MRWSSDKISRARSMKILQLIIFAVATLQAADFALPAGAKPRNLGSVGAGEGPAWDGRGNLYFTDERRITLRDSAGQIHVFRELPMMPTVCCSILRAGS